MRTVLSDGTAGEAAKPSWKKKVKMSVTHYVSIVKVRDRVVCPGCVIYSTTASMF